MDESPRHLDYLPQAQPEPGVPPWLILFIFAVLLLLLCGLPVALLWGDGFLEGM